MEDGQGGPPRESPSHAAPFRLGDWTVTPALNLVTRDDSSVHVRRQLMDLLVFLASRQGQVVSKEEIFQAVWPGQFVAESGLARCISQLRDVFEDDAREPRFIQTIPTRGYRLLPPVGPPEPGAPPTAEPPRPLPERAPVPIAEAPPEPAAPAPPAPPAVAVRRRWRPVAVLAAIAVAATGFALWRARPRPPALGARDTVLVAFENRTGEPAFDDTMQLALSVQLEQSPYLRVVSAGRVREALAFMHREADTRVTRELALELCQRVGATAVVAGSLAPVGRQYVIGLEGIACETGRTLARELVEVQGRERVLDGLGRAVSSMRGRLGESVASIHRFDVPIAQASTSSLEALKALSRGDFERARGRDEDAERWYRRAIELDPSFALAEMRLGVHLLNMDSYGEGTAAIRRAYASRERASEGERLYIESFYFARVRRDPVKAVEPLERWRDLYPANVVPRFTLASLYLQIGRLEPALDEVREALRLDPRHALAADVMMETLTAMGRFAEARSTGAALVSSHRDNAVTHSVLIDIACATGDRKTVDRQLEWGATTPSARPAFLDIDAALARSRGQFGAASRLTVQRIAAADEQGDALTGAMSALNEATDRALVGQTAEPRPIALAAVRRARTPETLLRAALVLALAGQPEEAERILHEYEAMPDVDASSDPDYKPALLAAIALRQGDPAAAVEILAPLRPYDLGWRFGFLPSYLRGLALLRLGRAAEAAAEFERITAYPGIVPTSIIHPLAWLQLARARAAAGDAAASRTAYDIVLRQWQDADPGLSVATDAAAERARAR